MKLPSFAYLCALGLILASCDTGEPEDNVGTHTIEDISDTALHVHFTKIKSAARKYRSMTGKYPRTVEEMISDGYLTPGDATDPWGNPWLLEEEGGTIVIRCYGADGKPGGTKSNRDRTFR